jgi:hypothetical protein
LRTVVTIDSAAFLTDDARLMLTAPASIAEGGESPVSAGIEVLATDGYLSWWGPNDGEMIRDWMTDADGGYQRAADFLMDQLVNELIPSWQAGRALADEFGMEFMIYEGGTLLLNGNDPAIAPRDLTDFAERFTRSAELKPVYAAMAEAWAEIGTAPFAWYADTGRPGSWGYYGHWDNITFDPQPRTEAIIDANRDRPGWQGDGRPAATFDNGAYDAGTAATDRMRGTGLDDRLYGLAGADDLAGRAGADRLWGGAGRDVIAGGTGGDDINGGDGADRINGGRGADTLTGGTGPDAFIFTNRQDGGDRITDFSRGDGFVFLGRAFGDLPAGELDGGVFQANRRGLATTDDARFIFDRDDGTLWFDADGNGAGAPVLIATLQAGADVQAADIVIF